MNAPRSDLFSCLFEPTDIVEVRTLIPGKGGSSKWVTAGKLAADGIDGIPEGGNVYFGANPRAETGGRSADHVSTFRCVWVDIDNCDVDSANHRWLDAGLPAPTAVVFSGGGVHLYWRLDEPITDAASWTRRQKRLIKLLNSDKAIHDPPRIMRYPGTLNTKRNKPCEVIDCKPGRTYPVDEFPEQTDELATTPMLGTTGALGTSGTASVGMNGLSRATFLFMSAGAQAGERNHRLFAAAADFAGCGIPIDDAYAKLLPMVVGADFTEQEGRAAIQSAYAKPRVPAKPEPVSNEWLAKHGMDLPDGAGSATSGAASEQQAQLTQTQPKPASIRDDTFKPGTPRISNVADEKVQTEDGPINKCYARSVQDIAQDVYKFSNDWPRVVGGQLFVEQHRGDHYVARLLRNHDDLFAWVHEWAMFRWGANRSGAYDKLTGQVRSPVTRQEFHLHLKETCPKRYVLVADIPHYPLIESVHYLPCDLPRATGKHLAEFVDHMNPETANDRKLLMAAIVTTVWGGGMGQRPMFVFTAKTRQGSGKTATALAIADVVGGAFLMDPKAKWAENAKAMMSSDRWAARVILWDNVKGRFGGDNIEAAVTAPSITGWQAYTGTISRLNDVTHFVTLNDPELSPDLALRSVEIRIGAPKHGVQFIDWARKYLAQHRLAIIADAIALLQSPPACVIKHTDRFGAWQKDVLSRIPDGDQLAEWIIERRGSLDGDAKLGEDVAEALHETLLTKGRVSGEVTSDDLYTAAVTSGVWKDDPTRGVAENRRRAVRMVCQMLGAHGLKVLTNDTGTPLRKRHTDDKGSRFVTLYDWQPVVNIDDLPC